MTCQVFLSGSVLLDSVLCVFIIFQGQKRHHCSNYLSTGTWESRSSYSADASLAFHSLRSQPVFLIEKLVDEKLARMHVLIERSTLVAISLRQEKSINRCLFIPVSTSSSNVLSSAYLLIPKSTPCTSHPTSRTAYCRPCSLRLSGTGEPNKTCTARMTFFQ